MKLSPVSAGIQLALQTAKPPKAPIMVALAFAWCLPLFGSQVYFSPEGGVRDQVIKRINLSKATIDVAVYSFSSAEIAAALGQAQKRGVKVRVIRDRTQSSEKGDENDFLQSQGVEVRIRTGRGRGIMHDKFAIFDGREAFTGSYNWTNNAEHNNWENAFFTDEDNIVQSFAKEFEVIWNAPEKPTMKRKHRSRSKSFY